MPGVLRTRVIPPAPTLKSWAERDPKQDPYPQKAGVGIKVEEESVLRDAEKGGPRASCKMGSAHILRLHCKG